MTEARTPLIRRKRLLSILHADIATRIPYYTPDGASEPRTLRHTGLVLFHKTDGGWKMNREVASPALPPDSLMKQ